MINRLAIFAVDPGGSTGLAWGIVDLRSDTVVDAMQQRTHTGSATITAGRIEKMSPIEFQEAIRSQVEAINSLFDDFVNVVIDVLDVSHLTVEFVCEHFVLTTGPHKPGIEGIFPAFMVGALVQDFSERNLILQSASKGMRWNTRIHLERYDAWIRGREHERAAFAHLAARVHDKIR